MRSIFRVLAFLAFCSTQLLSLRGYAQTALDVSGANGGAILLGYDSRTCDASIESAVRYNSSSKDIEYCDGSAWSTIAPSGGLDPTGWQYLGSFDSTVAATCSDCDTGLDVPAGATQVIFITNSVNSEKSAATELSSLTVFALVPDSYYRACSAASSAGGYNCLAVLWPPASVGSSTIRVYGPTGVGMTLDLDGNGNVFYTDGSATYDFWGYVYYK